MITSLPEENRISNHQQRLDVIVFQMIFIALGLVYSNINFIEKNE